MNLPKLNILVISYYFPPYKRVGGRRWAKHVKYLNRLGENAYVLTGEFPDSSSSWDDDILEYEEKIIRLPLKPVDKPYYQAALPKTLLDKLRWKLSYYTWQFRKKQRRGNYADTSLPNKDQFLAAAKQLVREKDIGTVILSVGPFAYSEVVVQLKAEFPSLKCLIDYRDPWEESLTGLTAHQQKQELDQQLRVLKTADAVLTVNEDISQKIRAIYKGVKVITLPHCVDEDFLSISVEEAAPSGNTALNLVYGGELYSGLEQEMKNYVLFSELLSGQSGKISDTHFYSPYFSYEKILSGKVHLHPNLLKKDYQDTLLNSDLILLFKSPLSSEAFFSSKFYEILCLRKPILFFGKKGMVSDFIEKHRLGFHIYAENLQDMPAKILENLRTKAIPDKSYDLSRHSFEFHTKQLIRELHDLQDAV